MQGNGIGVLAINGENLYVGGVLTSIGGFVVTNIARWTGNTWDGLNGGVGGGMDEGIITLHSATGFLYAGGIFSQAGGLPATNVALWNGDRWTPLSVGVNGSVYAISEMRSSLFVGGRFNTAGGSPASNLARWDGTNWHEMGVITNYIRCAHSCPENGVVFALAAKGHELYVGGRFVYINGLFATNIARWDGTNWFSLGPGVDADVRDIVVSGDNVYVASRGRAGGLSLNGIGRWDGSAWHDVGGGVNDGLSIQALAVNGTDIYAGGVFRAIGGISANRIAKWDGQQWSALGSGIESEGSPSGVGALACNGSELYVGGTFNLAGGKPSTNIALWHIPHTLNLKRSGETLRLSWPATGSNFVLETCGGLSLSTWSAVPQAPVVSGRELVVTNEVSNTTRYYRLRRQ